MTTINISAADLYDEIDYIIQDVAGDIGLWGGRAPLIMRMFLNRIGRLSVAPNSGRNYRDFTDALQKIREYITPVDECIIYGHCLNPDCKKKLKGPADVQTVTCSCGSEWTIKAVKDARLTSLRGQTITCTPKAAGEWLEWKTGEKVTRKRIGM